MVAMRKKKRSANRLVSAPQNYLRAALDLSY